LKGAVIEDNVLEEIRKFLEKEGINNCVVFNGWNGLFDVEKDGKVVREQREFDFLVIAINQRSVLHIEVKAALETKAMKKAGQQLKEGLKVFQENIPFHHDDQWIYTRAMYFSQMKENITPCDACHSFVLDSQSFDKNFTEIFRRNLAMDVSKSVTSSFLDSLKFLLFQMYIQNDCTTQRQIAVKTLKNINETSGPDIIKQEKVHYFWTKEQYTLMTDPSKQRVLFKTTYGTGKTTLLIAKAKELAEKKENIIVVIFSNIESPGLKAI